VSTESLKEYIITLHDHNELDRFYEDMETPGGDLYIPDRAVEVANRREISRNTHYYLTDSEADRIRNDSRVRSVALEPSQIPRLEKRLRNIIDADFDYGYNAGFPTTLTSNMANWGLDFCTRGVVDPNKGTYCRIPASGRNVDLVVIDEHIGTASLNHPEFARNSDGTGGSRVIRHPWTSTYDYERAGSSGYHGLHVASTTAGNRQGWASSANIYNFDFSHPTLNPFDVVRQWHQSKSINPATGRKNPTVTNNSWGYSSVVYFDEVQEAFYQGAKIYVRSIHGTFDRSWADRIGVQSFLGRLYVTVRLDWLDIDAVDLWNSGVFSTVAAGNDTTYFTESPSDPNFGNYILLTDGSVLYTHRGSSPAGPGLMVVGSLESGSSRTFVYRSVFSNHGPGLDIFAPGSDIVGALDSSWTHGGTVNDPRNSSYQIGRLSGTSMAAPQVAGVAACLLELYPDYTPNDIYNYLIAKAKNNLITDAPYPAPGNVVYNTLLDQGLLNGSPNRSLYYQKYRPDVGMNWPRVNNDDRPASGQCWPRMTKY
jgi:subtilisin family serine protease